MSSKKKQYLKNTFSQLLFFKNGNNNIINIKMHGEKMS